MSASPLLRFIESVLSAAQAGLAFSTNHFDIERYKHLRDTTTAFLAQSAGLDPDELRRWVALDHDYPTPKLDVRAMVLNEQQQVLLVRENADSLWTLPGGWCDIGDSPAGAMAREVLEEAGLEVEPVRLLALFDKHRHAHPPQLPHAYKAFFLCRVLGGALTQQTAETSGARYFDIEALPALSLHRVLPEQIRLLAARMAGGQTDALFD